MRCTLCGKCVYLLLRALPSLTRPVAPAPRTNPPPPAGPFLREQYETHPITDNYPTSPDPSPGQTRTKPKLTVDELLAPASKERKEWQYAAPRPLARARARGEMAEEKPEVEHVEDVRSMRRVPSYRTSRSRKVSRRPRPCAAVRSSADTQHPSAVAVHFPPGLRFTFCLRVRLR